MTDDRIAEILGDYLEKRERGEQSDPQDLLRTHTEIAGALREHLDALGLLDAAFSDAPGSIASPPTQIGEYQVLREIGRGGMGVVYEALQIPMRRRVALKVLYPSITRTPRAVKRFQREARAAGMLQHTNIVPVHAIGEDKGVWFYSMELVSGRPLNEVIDQIRAVGGLNGGNRASLISSTAHQQEGGTAPTKARKTSVGDRSYYIRLAEMFAGVADALQTAHDQKITHRDVKPSNLILDEDGTLKILDFGLARIEGEGQSMTITGDLLGTPSYMSPEQAMARRIRIDHRTDIYSLAATMYEVLTLRPPFLGEDLKEICTQIITKDPALPRWKDRRVPKDLETIVMKAMEKDRDRRYQKAVEMARDLRRFAAGAAVLARPVGPLGRLGRKIRRNKARVAVVMMLVLLAVTAGTLAAKSVRDVELRRDQEVAARLEKAQHKEIQYKVLLSKAESSVSLAVPDQYIGSADDHDYDREMTELLGDAISLQPDRPRAYLLRSRVRSRPVEDCLGDIDAAVSRGFSPRTAHLARALVLLRGSLWGESEEHWRRAEEEERAARLLPVESPDDAYFEGELRLKKGDVEEAIERFTAALGIDPDRTVPVAWVLYARANARVVGGELEAAIEDLAAFEQIAGQSLHHQVKLAILWKRVGRENLAEEKFEQVLKRATESDSVSTWREVIDACGPPPFGAEFEDRATGAALLEHGDSAFLHIQRARVLYYQGDYEAQLKLAKKALQIEPHTFKAHLSYAHALEMLGRFGEALVSCNKAVELAPEIWATRHRRASVLLGLGRYPDALEAAKKALSLGRASHSHSVMGRVLARMDRFEEALGHFKKALQIDPNSSRAPLTNMGFCLQTLGRHEESLAPLERAIEIDPKFAYPWYLKGVSLMMLHRHKEALVALNETIKLGSIFKVEPSNESDPGWPQAQRSEVLRHLGRFREALDAANEAVRLSPNSVDFLVKMAVALERLGRLDESLAVLEPLERREPEHKGLLLVLGAVLDKLGRVEGALAAHRRAIELGTIDCHAYVHSATQHKQNGRLREALADMDRHAAVHPDSIVVHLNRDYLLARMNRLDEALAAVEWALELRPDHLKSKLRRGTLLSVLGRSKESLEVFDRLLEEYPDDARIHGGRGSALSELYRYDEAIEAYDCALELEPESPRWLRKRAWCLRGLGRWKDAIAGFRRGAVLGSDDPYSFSHLAYVLRSKGLIEEGLAVAKDAAARFPEEEFLVLEQVRGLRAFGRIEEARQAAEAYALDPDPYDIPWTSALICAYAGKRERAREIIGQISRSSPRSDLFSRGMYHSYVGETDAAFEWLELATEKGYRVSSHVPLDPEFDSIKDDPRMAALLDILILKDVGSPPAK
ncbi:MAG: tetratricopeptide repeat protein [Planctomycetota bacterium]|nr:tetratricopeptide repeat protein [Planctomycetota bacterium]